MPVDPSSHRLARLVGALLLLMTVVAIFAEVGVRSTFVVSGDAEQTMALIGARPMLFRMGLVGFLTAYLLDVPVAVLLHQLTRPVGPVVSSVSMAFRLVYTAIVSAALLPWLGAVLLLDHPDALSAFSPAQVHQLVLLGLELFGRGFALALVFFGVHLALLGPLLARSGGVPSVLGGLVGLGGLAYVGDGLLAVLAPELRPLMLPVVGILGMAEVVLAGWLVVRGWPAQREA